MKSRQEILRLSRQKFKRRLLLILLCVLVVSVVAAIVLVSIMSGDESSQPKKDPPEIIAGESIENNYPIAYPTMQESQIKRITVANRKSYEDYYEEGKAPVTTYALFRDESNDGKFVLSYQDREGNPKLYYPPVADKDAAFDYESLYAIEQNDGYGRIHKLTYLCLALELPYFTDRIALLPEGAARDSQLRGFGLDEPQATITFDYVKENKETVTRSIRIGDKNVTGFGYYFMVTEEAKSGEKTEYRPYIYNSMAEYYNYALLGFYSYVNSILVSAGLEEDSSYEPYLTTDYKQWKNEVFEEAGTAIEKDSTAIIFTDVFTPVESRLDKAEYEKDKDRFVLEETLDKNSDAYKSGYIKDGYSEIEVDLSKKDGYQKFANALVGKGLGEFSEDVIITLFTDSKNLYFDGKVKATEYIYEITEIEAILTDAADITAKGTAVGDNGLVRVKYKLKIDGKYASEVFHHGVLDLSNSSLDTAAVLSIRGASVGELASPISLKVEYTEENSVTKNVKYIVDEIIEIYNEDGQNITVVTDKSQVYYRYCFLINGKRTEYETGFVDFASDTSDTAKKLKDKFLGKNLTKAEEVKGLNITLLEYTSHYEYMQDFMTYSIKAVNSFVTSELVSAFAFWNNSERDSFYGESIYENKLEQNDKNSLYAINSATCELVMKILGGIGDNSNSSEGLIGIENVAVGLTPEIKELYGLYAHTVYFELPRGVIVIDSGDADTVDDYSQYQKLGFTLFISEETFDTELGINIRYVGSDLYDVVAKVRAEDLVFLDYGFVEFWARRSLLIFDIKHLENMKLEFMMEDLKGSYEFHVPHASKSTETFEVRVFERCLVSGTKNHAEGCGCKNTELRELMGERNFITLSELYTKKFIPTGEKYYNSLGQLLFGYQAYDTAGVGYFREFVGGIYSTGYSGTLTEDEQKAALSSPLLMRMSIRLDMETAKNTYEGLHVYEFYRLDDRRIMVCQYLADSEGNATTEKVTDFYITTLAFKRIVGNAFAILDAKLVDQDTAYPEVSK